MGLFVAGVNPRRPVFLMAAQQLADAGAHRAFLAGAASRHGLTEALLLADGARVELYAVAEEGCDAYDIAADLLGDAIGVDVAGALYFAEGLDAASHLFAALCDLDEFSSGHGGQGTSLSSPFVAGTERAALPSEDAARARISSLSSPLPQSPNGEGEASRDALRQAVGPLSASWSCAEREARRAATFGEVLSLLGAATGRLASALAASEESASTAALGETAVELARRVFGHLERKSVLLLGASDLLASLGEAFARAGVEDFTFLGSEEQVARARAAGVRTATPEGLAVVMGNADVVLAGRSLANMVLDRRLMKGAVRLRRGRPMLLIDGSPDNSLIERRAAAFDGVFLYTADDLAAITRDVPWAQLGAGDARGRLLADAVRNFALQLGQ